MSSVSGGLAAARTAQALRFHGHSGSITVLTEEAEHPYDRPLSKDVLLGQDSSPTVLLSPGEAKSSGIDVRLSHRVTGLDLEKKMVAVPDGPPLAYGSLGIADRHARSLAPPPPWDQRRASPAHPR